MFNRIDAQRDKLLNELMKIDFAVIELNLYLDTHPNDRNAINSYNIHVEQSKYLKDIYEKNFGPLTARYSKSNFPWQWSQNPWPWDKNFMRGDEWNVDL